MRVLNKVMIASVLALTSGLAMAQTTAATTTAANGAAPAENTGMMHKHHMKNGGHKGMHCMGFSTKGLNLSEQQQAQLQALCQQQKHQPRMDSETRAEMHKIMTASKFDEAAARKMFEKVNAQRVDSQVEQARIRNQMYNLLTPAQQAKVNQRYQARQPVAATAPAAN
ncbi:MAG: Spy/CpxP family protein refolding chaperone [Plesiomonas sp.]|uniref:Spy/CpxP family protein refolding chaperone n=1 Tax=Plesiomonas sp. TaxID=2486279 RepID=UPI003F2F5711